jgi:hypothetical protein
VKFFKKIATWFGQHQTGADGLVALVLVGLAFLDLYINWGTEPRVPLAVAVSLTLILILPFMLRRRYPLAVLAVMTAALIVYRSLAPELMVVLPGETGQEAGRPYSSLAFLHIPSSLLEVQWWFRWRPFSISFR